MAEPRPSLPHRIGDFVLLQLRVGLQLQGLFARTLHFSLRGRHRGRHVATQMFAIGNESVFFLVVVMGFIGMISVYQAGLQMQRVIPDMTQLGTAYFELLVKDLAATISALMLATRVGAGIAAELGAMVVTEQVDALRMCAADPVDYLVRPRFLASLMMTVILIIIAAFVAGASGALTARVFFEIQPSTFLNFSEVDMPDVVEGGVKSLAYGATIPIVSAHSGLSTRGGSEGVGAATTRAVVGSSLAIIVLDFIVSALVYLLLR